MQTPFTRFLLIAGFLLTLLPTGYAQHKTKGLLVGQPSTAGGAGSRAPSTCSSCYADRPKARRAARAVASAAPRGRQLNAVTGAAGAYLRSAILPWGRFGDSTNTAAMSEVFGANGWEGFFFDSTAASTIFSASRTYVFIEGSDAGAQRFSAFLQANRATVETWVAAGGHLFLNAAPNQGGEIDLGFGGVTLKYDPLRYNSASSYGVVEAGHPIAAGPFTPAGNEFMGFSFSHAVMEGPNIKPVITGSEGVSLAYADWGRGAVFFGGLTTDGFHEPTPNAHNLLKNILSFTPAVACSSPVITVPGALTANNTPGQCGATVAFEASATGTPAPAIVYSVNGSEINSSFVFPTGTTTVTATATNNCGADTKTFTVQVKDTELPTITAPAAVLVGTSPGQCFATNVAVGTATFADNCAGAVLSNNAPATYPKGTTTVTWTATDAAGNVATTTQTVTVTDQQKPVLTLPANVTVNAAATTTSAVVSFSLTATDNCGGVTVISQPASGSTFPIGVSTVTVTATDTAGNTATGTFTVNVQDVTPPTVKARNVTVILANGTASVTAAQIDNGSYDASGIASLSLSRTTFTCASLGTNTVTLTVTDTYGNVASATAVVTVVGTVPAPTITVTSADKVYTGGNISNLYLGYGAQSVTLTAAGGVSYVWSPATGLSSATIANPVFTAKAEGTYTYKVTATNQYGCTSTATVRLNVSDAQCGNKNDKVLVCHNGHEICISANAVEAHLREHDDYLGSCQTSFGRKSSASSLVVGDLPKAATAEEKSVQQAFVLEAFPNPFSASTTVHFRPTATAAAKVRIVDQLGRVMTVLFDGVAEAGRDYTLTLSAEHLSTGLYRCEFVSQGNVQAQRLSVMK
jgi:hypothetical protein